MGLIWTPEQCDRLTALWIRADKPSCTQIAVIMNTEFAMGISRSAVIGKVHRLNLEQRGQNSNYKGNGRSTERKAATFAKRKAKSRPAYRHGYARPVFEVDQIELPPPAVEPLNIGLMKSTALQCKWIQGDDDLVCGHPTIKGGAWCAYHRSIVYKKPERRAPVKVLKPTRSLAGTWA